MPRLQHHKTDEPRSKTGSYFALSSTAGRDVSIDQVHASCTYSDAYSAFSTAESLYGNAKGCFVPYNPHPTPSYAQSGEGEGHAKCPFVGEGGSTQNSFFSLSLFCLNSFLESDVSKIGLTLTEGIGVCVCVGGGGGVGGGGQC